MKLRVLAMFVATLLMSAHFAMRIQAKDHPNILLLVADDLGWNDVCYHGSRCRTPNMDRLVASGVELDQHYVQPVCSPTRAALLTGRFPSRFGPHAVVPTNLRVLPPGTATIATALRSMGYETFLAGKWHLGSRMEWGPLKYGFDHSYGLLAGAADPWTHGYRTGLYAHTWHRDQTFIHETGNVTELLAQQVIRWIRQKHEPWFIYVPFTAVHIPIDAPDEYKKLYEGETYFDDLQKDESFKRYAAFVSQMDAKIGEFMLALTETGQRNNTLVLFFSDNGGHSGGENEYLSNVPAASTTGSNLPLRGEKAQLYEGGIRVPAWVHWPGVLKSHKVTAPIHAVDWMPTITKLVGWESTGDLYWDGCNIWRQITGERTKPEPRLLYWACDDGHAVRAGDWKLIVRGTKNELFNLANDPYEKADCSIEHVALVVELSKRLEQFQKQDLLKLPEDLRGVSLR